jgi:hypothetical protein
MKLKAAVMVSALVLAGGAALFAYSTRAADAPREKRPPAEADKAPAARAEEKLDAAIREKIRKLQVERRDVLKNAVRAREQAYLAGRASPEALLKLSGLLLEAELDLATTAQQRIAAHAAELGRAREMEKVTTARYEAGQTTQADYHLARAARLKAEINWLKAGGKEGNEKDAKP